MDNIVALIPSIGTGILFVIVLRAILFADRRERAAVREFEAGQQSSAPVPGDNDRNEN